MGALVQRAPPPQPLRRHPASRIRSSVLRCTTALPDRHASRGWKPIARASIRPRAVQVLGLDIGDSENEPFWKEFGGLVDRGLAGVRLVISDAHASLIKAIRPCFQGASWQRCRVHARRNLLAAPNHRHCQVIAALIRTIFVQPDTNTATAQLRAVVDQLLPYAPGVADRLEKMETDLLAYTGFPTAHWSKIWSNNPIERLNRELKRRTDVVGIFPDKASVIRLVGALLVEINDEMIAAERRYIAAASVADLTDQPAELALPAAPRT